MTAAAAPPELAHHVEVVPWDAFVQTRLAWRQGEHVALVGPTGQGKTTAALQLIRQRRYRLVLGTKPRDATLRGLVRRQGYQLVRSWPPAHVTERVILWPRWRTPGDTPRQAAVIGQALTDVFASGGWCVLVDDVQYLTEMLGLRRTLDMLWLQARSINVSVLAASQRPVWVPRNMWAMSTHLFVWGTRDSDDLRSLGGLNGADTATVRAVVAQLPPHWCLYVNTRTGDMCATRAHARPTSERG